MFEPIEHGHRIRQARVVQRRLQPLLRLLRVVA
jgi:hypothetical protein